MNDKIEKLKDLVELFKSGVITEEEFNALKKELLSSIKKGAESDKKIPAADPNKPISEDDSHTSTIEDSSPKSSAQDYNKPKEKRPDTFFQNTDQFWETFHASLKSPISYWRDCASHTVIEWIDNCSDSQFRSHLNIIFDNAPLLKGEYPVVWSDGTGMILTNYRLFVNIDTGLFIIPLCNLTSYLVLNDENLRIEYNDSDGEIQFIDVYAWLPKEYVDSAIVARQWTILNEKEMEYLPLGFFDLKRLYDLRPNKVDFNYSKMNSSRIDVEKEYGRLRIKVPFKKVLLIASSTIFLIFLFNWMFAGNEYSNKIEESCKDCSETEINDSDFILVTNSEGKSNVFSKSKMSYILSEWYEAEYNEGFFYDDITFEMNGKKIVVPEGDYSLLDDYFLLSKSQPTDYDQWKIIVDKNHEFICECHEEAENMSDGIYEAIKDCEEKYFLGFNFRDKLSQNDNEKAIKYSDRLFDERQRKIKKYVPESKISTYTCSICGKEIGSEGSSMWNGKCYQCYQYSKPSGSNVDLTRP